MHADRRWLKWVVPVAVVLLVAGALVSLRGLSWYRRTYYPLKYTDAIRSAAQRHTVNPYLIAAVIRTESGFRPDIVSKAGAVGLMQVLPGTASELRKRKLVDMSIVGGKELSDPAVNIEYGTAYLRYLVNRYHEVETVLAAYNAGLGNADVWAAKGGDIRKAIEFPETKRYVTRVVAARQRYAEAYPHVFDGWDAKQ